MPPAIHPVAPYAGAWIEISRVAGIKRARESLPTRERGLKLLENYTGHANRAVAPYAGAWIEMITEILPQILELVAPYAGAWIEIYRPSDTLRTP